MATYKSPWKALGLSIYRGKLRDRSGIQHVYKRGNSYFVMKFIDGKSKWFGTRKTLEEAIRLRDSVIT